MAQKAESNPGEYYGLVLDDFCNMNIDLTDDQILSTKSFDTLWVPPSSSCGGLVAFGHNWGPFGPLAGGLWLGAFSHLNFY